MPFPSLLSAKGSKPSTGIAEKDFKRCLSAGFLLPCLSLFFPWSFTALVPSLTRGYNSHSCPSSPGSVLSPCLWLPVLLHIQTRPFSSQFDLVNQTRAALSWRKPSWVTPSSPCTELPQLHLCLPCRAPRTQMQARIRGTAAAPDALGICSWFLIVCCIYGSRTLAKSGLHGSKI